MMIKLKNMLNKTYCKLNNIRLIIHNIGRNLKKFEETDQLKNFAQDNFRKKLHETLIEL